MYWWGPLVLIFTFFLMETIAWATHKYLMHGLMWMFHEDHHVKGENKLFEKNDIFFLIFAIPSWLCIMLGMIYNHYFFVWMGYGIAVYGFAYFLVHDVFIHRRFKWIRNIETPYFSAIRKAHKVHHKKQIKEGGECFGMLWVPRKYYIEARNAYKAKSSAS
jgi:beta-carotene 3-hydroxylase